MEKQNQEQKNKTASNVLIVILILIMLATSAFGIFAWARYQTTVEGQSTAQVAKWEFKVNGNGTQTQQVSFLMTRTDNNQTVAEGTIAPGTYGEIPIEIDVTGTQTDLVYTIIGSTENMPRNFRLYYDEARTQEMVVLNQKFSKGKYLKVSDIGTEEKKISETIYWEWPFETGEEVADIERNNIKDTEDMGKTMTMSLTVEGKQLNGAPVLADVVQIGDYVNYDANSGELGPQTFSNDDAEVGTIVLSPISTETEFNSEAKSQWRVFSIDRSTGVVELIAVDSTEHVVQADKIDGFANIATTLNNIGAMYGHGKGANLGRSIDVDDIQLYSTYDPATFGNSAYKYGDQARITLKAIGDISTNLDGAEVEKLAGTTENPALLTFTHYDYIIGSYITNNTIYELICKKSTDSTSNLRYLLASTSTYLGNGNAMFFLRCIWNNANLANLKLYYNNGDAATSYQTGVRPIVELNPNITTTGQNADGVWQLKVD